MKVIFPNIARDRSKFCVANYRVHASFDGFVHDRKYHMDCNGVDSEFVEKDNYNHYDM